MNRFNARFPFCVVLPAAALVGIALSPPVRAGTTTIEIATPQPPPDWALLERELLRANADACREFFHTYFDERGFYSV